MEQRDWIRDRLSVDRFYGAEYCFSTLFNWQEHYGTRIAPFEGFAVLENAQGAYCYFGSGDRKKLISALEQEAAKREQPLELYGLLEKEKQRLEAELPGKFTFREERDSFDYCYRWETLAELRGRKLATKRGHIRKFMTVVPDWSYEPMTEENIPACKEMAESWYQSRYEAGGEDMSSERLALLRALDHFREEELIGGLLRGDGEILGISLGYPVNEDTMVVHFEKADPSYPGSYQMINQRFVLDSCRGFSRINREDDMGVEGLRSTKLSYDPAELLVKYSAIAISESIEEEHHASGNKSR